MRRPTVPPEAEMPSVEEFLLPQRAYLLSYRDQALPARRVALDDARASFDGAADDESRHVDQLQLLGVIGEAMQAVEDVGTLGSAMMNGLPGLPFYVAATVYRSADINNFFAGVHKRDSAYFMRLCGYRFEGFEMAEFFSFEPAFSEAERAAFAAAEEASAKMVAEHLVTLARAWERYRRFFHAYKHGALLANPDDMQIVEEDEAETELGGLIAWRRRAPSADIGSHSLTPLGQIADHVEGVGMLALDMMKFIIDTRLGMFEGLEFTDDGSVSPRPMNASPWQFWMRRSDVSQQTISLLAARGVVIDEPR
jgi:hypothetical protein